MLNVVVFCITPTFAIAIGIIRMLVKKLPFKDDELNFKFRTLPLIAYGGCLVLILAGWVMDFSRYEAAGHTYFLSWITGWAGGTAILYGFMNLEKQKG
jgi:multisubunit Na+/H+ antiporter MnhB subunit